MLELVAIVRLVLVCPYYIGGIRLMLSDAEIAICAGQVPRVGVAAFLVALMRLKLLIAWRQVGVLQPARSIALPAPWVVANLVARRSSRYGVRRVLVRRSVAHGLCTHCRVVCGCCGAMATVDQEEECRATSGREGWQMSPRWATVAGYGLYFYAAERHRRRHVDVLQRDIGAPVPGYFGSGYGGYR